MSQANEATSLQASKDVQGDHAVSRVSPEERRSTFDVAIVAAGFCIAMSGLFAGSAMAMGLSLRQAILATVIGNTILAVYGGLVGAAGAREGVGTAMLSRHSFGRKGSMIIGGVLAITMLGWYSVQVGFFGITINTMFPEGGFITNARVAALWGGLLMMMTAYFGYKGLSLLSKIAIPALLITSFIGIYAAVRQVGSISLLFDLVPPEPVSLGVGIVIAVGSFAAGASAQADITRYARDSKAAWIATIFGFVVANSFVILAGLITSLATGTGDLPSSMLALGLGFPALIVLISAQWTTNDNNLYTSSLGLSNIINVKKSRIVLVGGILATLIGVAGLADYFVAWLVLLGVTIPPMAGIIIVDYYVLKKGKYEYGPGTEYVDIYWPAFIAWILASVLGYYIPWGTGALNSLVLGSGLYLIIDYLMAVLKINVSTGMTVEDETGF
ncbi:MAG: thiamine permease [delta proteobacterium ML8_F1]|nr:MAG: thiamine permease [delta proteobacterium ML8_F1]